MSTQCSLFLYPKQHNFDAAKLTTQLAELKNIGLIDAEIKGMRNCYYTGEKFLDYIVYMGCAPAIQFEASEGSDDFCHIKIRQYKTHQLIASKIQSKAPLCPQCKKPVKAWQQAITESNINCPHCNNSASIGEFNWRRMAGYARCFIEIASIYPKEAIPQPQLLAKLTNAYASDWLYFYSCH